LDSDAQPMQIDDDRDGSGSEMDSKHTAPVPAQSDASLSDDVPCVAQLAHTLVSAQATETADKADADMEKNTDGKESKGAKETKDEEENTDGAGAPALAPALALPYPDLAPPLAFNLPCAAAAVAVEKKSRKRKGRAPEPFKLSDALMSASVADKRQRKPRQFLHDEHPVAKRAKTKTTTSST
jgi:hypothetical protein